MDDCLLGKDEEGQAGLRRDCDGERERETHTFLLGWLDSYEKAFFGKRERVGDKDLLKSSHDGCLGLAKETRRLLIITRSSRVAQGGVVGKERESLLVERQQQQLLVVVSCVNVYICTLRTQDQLEVVKIHTHAHTNCKAC